MAQRTISVVIPCRNYGSFLPRCLQSLLGQSRLPDEILVVDDASEDDTAQIAARFQEHGVRYMRVDFRSPLLSRKAGVQATHGEIVCCIDADDYVDPFYLEQGLAWFERDQKIGIVYSDIEFFGEWQGRTSYPESSDKADIAVENYIHSGALMRRDAVDIAEPFAQSAPSRHHEDWLCWRKIIEQGWRAVKQEAFYHYRKHNSGLSRDRHYGIGDYTYYEGAALSEEVITLFTPLAGRREFWTRYTRFLEQQTWNHRRINLVLMDTSRDPEFSRMVRHWVADSDYPMFQYLRVPVGRPGLADECRVDEEGYSKHDVLKDVRLAMARIYNKLKSSLSTNYLWVVEDDVIPPLDACDRLLRSFCQHTVSVSAVIEHRYEPTTVSWDLDGTLLADGHGVQQIGGNGFGCVMLRASAVREAVFSSTESHPDYDRCFYAGLKKENISKLDWSIRCEHLSPRFDRAASGDRAPAQKLEQPEFDEEYYFKRNPDVALAVRRGDLDNGYSHYDRYGFSERRAARALLNGPKNKQGQATKVEPAQIQPTVLTANAVTANSTAAPTTANGDIGLPRQAPSFGEEAMRHLGDFRKTR